eukprot:EG_transcript_511
MAPSDGAAHGAHAPAHRGADSAAASSSASHPRRPLFLGALCLTPLLCCVVHRLLLSERPAGHWLASRLHALPRPPPPALAWPWQPAADPRRTAVRRGFPGAPRGDSVPPLAARLGFLRDIRPPNGAATWLYLPLGATSLAVGWWLRFRLRCKAQALRPAPWAIALTLGPRLTLPRAPVHPSSIPTRGRAYAAAASRRRQPAAKKKPDPETAEDETSATSAAGPLSPGEGSPPPATEEGGAEAALERIGQWAHPIWQQHLSSHWPLRPAASRLLPLLNGNNVLGHPSQPKNQTDSLFQFACKQKQLHPDKVLLVKVGEFYETWGLDAVLLVQHCGLNAMGGNARAGCPLGNVQQTVDALVEVGLMVAVYEEGPGAEGSRTKSRFLGGILSPGSSTYMYDARLRLGDIEYREGRPYIGVQVSASGATASTGSMQFTVYEVFIDSKCTRVRDKLTEEAVWCALRSCPEGSTLFYARTGGGDVPQAVHRMLSSATNASRRVPLPNAEAAPQLFLREMLQHLAKELERPDLANPTAFRFVQPGSTGQPRPLYAPSAQQLGLLPSPQIPDMVDALVPPSAATAAVKDFFRRWLLRPPPYRTADAMQELLRALLALQAPLPPLQHRLTAAKLGGLLQDNQANADLFRQLHEVVDVARRVVQPDGPYSTGAGGVTEPLLAVVEYESGIAVQRTGKELLQRCGDIQSRIAAVVPLDPEANMPEVEDLPGYLSAPLKEMFDANEARFCWSIRRDASTASTKAFTNVENARRALIKTMDRDYNVYQEKEIKYNFQNNQVSVSMTGSIPAPWMRARDRKGKEIKSLWTTSAVERATYKYLTACEDAVAVAEDTLRNLCNALVTGQLLPSAMVAVYLKDVLLAADLHAREAVRRGWCLPPLEPAGALGEVPVCLQLRELRPYWLLRDEAVPNDVELRGQWLLTGPNMSGKSTLLRSVTAAALLANCGFAVPVSPAGTAIPRIDGYFLRTNTTDCPKEGMSSFALEAEDMRLLLRDATSRSLAAVDEFGRGTAPAEGAALAGELLEELDARRCPSIFATHLHFELLQLPVHLPNTQAKRLRVDLVRSRLDPAGDDATVRWTYRLEDGVCADSLALATARRQEVPEKSIRRAEELLQVSVARSGIVRATLARPVEYPHLQYAEDGAGPTPVCTAGPCSTAPNKPEQAPALEATEGSAGAANEGQVGAEALPEKPARRRRSTAAQEERFGQAVKIVREACQELLDPTLSECRLRPGEMPPVGLTARGCLYMLHLADGSFYIGETDAVYDRLEAHRQLKGRHLEAVVFAVVGGKSAARKAEAIAIRSLQRAGLGPANSKDSQHRNFAAE